MADAIEAMDREQWQAYFEQTFLQNRHSLQVAAPGSRGRLPEGDQLQVESASQLKAGHAVYVIE